MTEETVKQAIILTSKVDKAERAEKVLTHFKPVEHHEGEPLAGPYYASIIASAVKLLQNDIDLTPVIDLLGDIARKHLVNSRAELAAL